MQALITELANYTNALIVGMSWAIVEIVSPIVTAIVKARWLKPYRRQLLRAAKHGKRLAAVVWCSALVWVPDAQPKLCGELPLNGCQSVFNRVAIGLILGVLLSSGHWSVARLWSKYTQGKGDTS